MAKVCAIVRRTFEVAGLILGAFFLGKLVADRNDDTEIDLFETERINQLAAKKREEALMRIERADARKLAESYSGVCDAICDGKERFRNRCKD